MKYNLLKYSFGFAVMVLLFSACDEGDAIVNQVTDNVTRGAILRGLDVQSNSVAINSATNVLNDGEEFGILLEFQDDEDGALITGMDVFVSYLDNTDDGADNSRDEVLFETVPSSSFTAGDRGLPTLQYNITGQQMQSTLGLADSQLGLGGDEFNVRFELVLSDGRRFSNGQNSGTITGSYFNSPFLYSVAVVCAPSQPTAGEWIFATTDTYGDGWNGASLNIVLDGADAGSIANVDGGPVEQEFIFDVPEGTQTISIMYAGGSFDCEVLFTITSANGNEVSSQGPLPPIGVELLDYCPDNL